MIIMELSRNSCRLCLSESEFNVPLFGCFSRKTNMLDKILVCLNIGIEESDFHNTICYKCANKIESYYDFTMAVKKSQKKLGGREFDDRQREAVSKRAPVPVTRRHATQCTRDQVFEADYTFSCLDVSTVDKQEAEVARPSLSYFFPADVKKQSNEPAAGKIPHPRLDASSARAEREGIKKLPSLHQHQHQHSPDLFESQSAGSFDWQLVPNNSLLKLVTEKCFSHSDF